MYSVTLDVFWLSQTHFFRKILLLLVICPFAVDECYQATFHILLKPHHTFHS